MPRLKLLYFLFAALSLVSLASCGDDDDDDVSPNVALLTQGEWTGSAVFVNGTDRTGEFEAQSGIDISLYTSLFERDGTYTDRYNDTVLVDGTWEYENAERVILFDKGTSDEYRVVISKLDEDELFYIQAGIEFRFMQ
ncbi:hypothetical protein [Pontibacter kalidii]|uniref:hypothetical protein n=1 Tax=Pontibacter kalidii TaxID=2592049 RepID=UPI002254BE84|nr:hypothetical protein [Pontibacter kalidii]